jgi:O-methyltransferase
MDNVFLSEYFDWGFKGGPKTKILNNLFKKINYNVRIVPLYPGGYETNLETRLNIFHLLRQVLEENIEGDVMDIGCYTGHVSVILRKMIDYYKCDKLLHVYDRFDIKAEKINVKHELFTSFESLGLKLPIVCSGNLLETVPENLPPKICFTNIDCGYGQNQLELKNVVLHLLEHIYTRMYKLGVCTLMDYCDTSKSKAWNSNPGVKMACDEFFKDKPEKVFQLNAGDYAQGYFKKL